MANHEENSLFRKELSQLRKLQQAAKAGGKSKSDMLDLAAEMGALAEKTIKDIAKLIKISDINERKLMTAYERIRKQKTELEAALANIKQLKGLIPICSSCKKIRNDKGYWQQVEVYVAQHTEADFSHGLCDECAHKLYPQYFADKKNMEQ